MVTIRKRTGDALRAVRRIPRTLRVAMLLSIALAAVALVAAGGGMPRDAVATVDGETIDEVSFEHWLTVAARTSGRPGAQVPDPPGYTACIAQKRNAQPKPAKGQAKATDEQLEEQCARFSIDRMTRLEGGSSPALPRASRRRGSTRPSSRPAGAGSWARSRRSSATTSSRS